MPLVFLGELLVGVFSGSSGSIGFGFGFGVWGSSSSLLPSVVISSLLTLRISSSSSVGCCGCGYLEAIFVVVGGFMVCGLLLCCVCGCGLVCEVLGRSWSALGFVVLGLGSAQFCVYRGYGW